jgi:hypothetical protein
MRESGHGGDSPLLCSLSVAGRAELWLAEGDHPIKDVASHQRLGFLRISMRIAKSWTNGRLVPKEGVLQSGLVMIARILLPLAPPDLLHPHEGACRERLTEILVDAIASDFSKVGRPHWHFARRWQRISRSCHRGCVYCDTRDIALNFIEEIESRLRIVSVPAGQKFSDADTRSIDAVMELLPAMSAASSMLGCGLVVFGPVDYVTLSLVLGIDSRLHPRSAPHQPLLRRDLMPFTASEPQSMHQRQVFRQHQKSLQHERRGRIRT